MHAHLCVGGKDVKLVLQAHTYACTHMRGGGVHYVVMQAHTYACTLLHVCVGGKDVTLFMQAHTYACTLMRGGEGRYASHAGTHICMHTYAWGGRTLR